jgi:hypothetical protein
VAHARIVHERGIERLGQREAAEFGARWPENRRSRWRCCAG